MTDKYIVPAKHPKIGAFLKIRYPDKPLMFIPETGIHISTGPYYSYWLRRINDGSVVSLTKSVFTALQPKDKKGAAK